MFVAMAEAGEVPDGRRGRREGGRRARRCRSPTASSTGSSPPRSSSTCPPTSRRSAELVRVLRPGGTIALTVPRWLPEVVCWKLSDDYHNTPGGHIRIYSDAELVTKAVNAGLVYDGRHYAHALHAPYWWIKCAVGVENDDHPLAKAYHRLLVWDIMKAPRTTRWAEKALNPLIGKSLVVYLHKPEAARCLLSSSPARRSPRPGAAIEAVQERDGAIPWTVGGHTDVWNHVEAAMALLRRRPARRGRPRLGVGTPHPAARRLVADEDRRRGRRGRQRRDQHGGVRRGRRLAPLAGTPRRAASSTRTVADRPARPRLRLRAAAAVRRHRLVAGVVRRTARPGSTATACSPARRASTTRSAPV